MIGGAGESLNTLRELELFVTELSGDTVMILLQKWWIYLGEKHLITMSCPQKLVNVNNSADSEIVDLSHYIFTLSTEIAPLSSETTRDISNVKSLTSYEISDLSSYYIK